jgi:hypothetical protein
LRHEGGAEVQLHTFLTAALDGDEWSIHASAAFFSFFSSFFCTFSFLVLLLLVV